MNYCTACLNKNISLQGKKKNKNKKRRRFWMKQLAVFDIDCL